MSTLISFILVIMGALNWLAISLFQYDIIAGIFGSQADTFSRIVYGLYGIAGLWLIYASIKGRGRLLVNGSMEADEQLLTMNKTEAGRTDRNNY